MNVVYWMVGAVLAFAIYFNVGWALGAYYYDNVSYKSKDALTGFARIAAGGWGCMSGSQKKPSTDKEGSCILTSIAWPIGILAVIASWLFWLIFGGISQIFYKNSRIDS